MYASSCYWKERPHQHIVCVCVLYEYRSRCYGRFSSLNTIWMTMFDNKRLVQYDTLYSCNRPSRRPFGKKKNNTPTIMKCTERILAFVPAE